MCVCRAIGKREYAAREKYFRWLNETENNKRARYPLNREEKKEKFGGHGIGVFGKGTQLKEFQHFIKTFRVYPGLTSDLEDFVLWSCQVRDVMGPLSINFEC